MHVRIDSGTAWAALAACLLLAACATPQEQAARAQAQVEQMMAVYGPACSRLGYARGSDAWRGCVLQLSMKDDLQRYGFDGPGPYGPYWGPGGWGPGYWRRWSP